MSEEYDQRDNESADYLAGYKQGGIDALRQGADALDAAPIHPHECGKVKQLAVRIVLDLAAALERPTPGGNDD